MIKDIIKNTEKAVREAGKCFFTVLGDEKSIISKGFANYVTDTDFAVQKLMMEELKEIMPESNFISEELDQYSVKWDKPTWVLDPVDGTTNYMYQYRHSAISLALFVDGSPSMGIVYNPYLDEMFTAFKGEGAFLNGERIAVSGNKKLEDCLIGFGTTPYDRSKAGLTFDITEKVFLRCRDVRRSGSAALDISYVACGRLDGFYEMNLQIWDYAAGMVILKEAGGICSRWNGDEINPANPGSILGSNGLVHKELVSIIGDIP
ncbi:myo-inositol-1(or 4)-monophosphatase [Anaerobacterium chartisolvens]|uniref:Inositol-1-monophosphatase n=1 Tax=Anaerobacterium chartisolvens TaxID=1297424 RepID=A0A369B7U1_9FIRM|nr:inositol monophosphatase family protein [Anaerobacterium chartisolvens]RCX17590.1 myo-inositol-1(or 4)-monophosphatase [Anaerobacterium chartisolvens]